MLQSGNEKHAELPKALPTNASRAGDLPTSVPDQMTVLTGNLLALHGLLGRNRGADRGRGQHGNGG